MICHLVLPTMGQTFDLPFSLEPALFYAEKWSLGATKQRAQYDPGGERQNCSWALSRCYTRSPSCMLSAPEESKRHKL